jgi:hypothetical protein
MHLNTVEIQIMAVTVCFLQKRQMIVGVVPAVRGISTIHQNEN